MIGTNISSGTSQAYTDTLPVLTRTNSSTLIAQLAQVILNMFERIQESNATLSLNEVEWRLTIDPRSLVSGSSPTVKIPPYVNQTKFRQTWVGHYDDQGPINCAAYAINYFLHSAEKRYDKYVKRSEQDARVLQDELGWGPETSLAQLKYFVDKYPAYRLTAFLPNATQSPATYPGKEYEWKEDLSNLIYLIYDPVQQHYGLTKSPQEVLIKLHRNNNWKWCHRCCVPFTMHMGHQCVDATVLPKRYEVACRQCGTFGKHTCPVITCRFCSTVYKRDTFEHRCILYKQERSEEKNKFVDEKEILPDGKSPALFVYDLEARIEIVESTNLVISDFALDEHGYYVEEEVATYAHTLNEHKANLVVFKNVFSDEPPVVYFGEDCLERFLMYMISYNHGNNICVAHNAAGYDTRLLFTVASKMAKTSIVPIMRGAKFMQLKVNQRLVFRDSLLHVKGSLRNLAKDFCTDTNLRKGHFPHLFNSIENYDYVGPIPDKKYFDLAFVLKNEKDKEEFDAWYNTWANRTDWNFMNELKAYCIDDVLILGKIVKGYHDVCVNSTGMTPWLNATAPSFVHEVFLSLLSKQLELPNPKEDMNIYSAKIQELADTKFWAVLKPNEYWFARKALRGGRTEIKKMYHHITDEEYAQGKYITYQDVNSLYPFQQVEHDFPTGTPTIHVWDPKYYPCIKHQNKECQCPMWDKGDRFLKIENRVTQSQWTSEQILRDPTFFGIVCATLIPPKNLYHPILVCWSEEQQKCIATLREEDHVEITTTSIEFLTALRNGYKLVQIHRYDQYTKTPSLWREKILDFYLEKMLNSGNPPENKEEFIKKWEDRFGIGEEIRKSIDEGRWGNYPAKKQTAKIMINSAWGKHAQRPVMPEAEIYDFSTDMEKVFDFFQNLSASVFSFKDAVILDQSRVMYRFQKDGDTANPDLHGGYLPAALFVPAYGRLQLWEQLNKLGKRVLMCDTDSIVYIYDPDQYNIPRGDMLGEWEVEKIDSKNGGIRTFVGLGPKTYGIKTNNGVEMVKAKGLSLNLATSKAINFTSMAAMALEFLEQGSASKISIPQQTFTYDVRRGMRTWKMLKDLQINKEDMKGFTDHEGHLYPFGFQN